jgi:hypothetical protein
MRLDIAIVCIAVLYGVDAVGFDGWYFAAVKHVISDVYLHW